MFTFQPKNLYDAIQPLAYLNWYIGMGTFRQPNERRATLYSKQTYTVAVTLINWTTIYIALNSITEVIHFSDSSPMALMMYKALVSVNACFTIIASLLVWLRKKGLLDCLRQMLILDNTFQTVFGAENEYRKQYIHLICQVVATVVFVFLLSATDIPWIMMSELSLLKNFAFFVTLHHPVIVMLVLDTNFCFFVGYLGKKFRDLNHSLLVLTKKPSASCLGKRLFIIPRKVVKMRYGNTMQNIESEDPINDRHYLFGEIRKAHLDLCKLSRKINLAFGIQNLLSMGISFVMITGLLYTIYSAFEWDDFTYSKLKEMIPTAIWTMIYIFKIFIINHSCFNVTTEAEKTGQLIYEIRLNSRVQDEELRAQIQEFGVQMLQNPVRFNACGFFTLNFTLVQGVMGSITTYLVILIQMSRVPENRAHRTTLVENLAGNSENRSIQL